MRLQLGVRRRVGQEVPGLIAVLADALPLLVLAVDGLELGPLLGQLADLLGIGGDRGIGEGCGQLSVFVLDRLEFLDHRDDFFFFARLLRSLAEVLAMSLAGP